MLWETFFQTDYLREAWCVNMFSSFIWWSMLMTNMLKKDANFWRKTLRQGKSKIRILDREGGERLEGKILFHYFTCIIQF